MLFSSDKANASRRPLLLVVNQSFSGICSRYSKVREEGGLKANATSIVHFVTLYVVYKNPKPAVRKFNTECESFSQS